MLVLFEPFCWWPVKVTALIPVLRLKVAYFYEVNNNGISRIDKQLVTLVIVHILNKAIICE